MADNEIQHIATATGIYGIVYVNGTSQFWNGSSYETFADAAIATYATTMTQEGTSSVVYSTPFPSGMSAGTYSFAVVLQAGASMVLGDLANVKATGNAFWDGTHLHHVSTPSQNWGGTGTTATDRTLTQSAPSIAAAVSATSITQLRGDKWSMDLVTSVDVSANRTETYFTIKDNISKPDSGALLQIDENAGLVYLNGSGSVTAGNGSITWTTESTGALTIVLEAAESAQLVPGTYDFDIQVIRSAGLKVQTIASGSFIVSEDVTLTITA